MKFFIYFFLIVIGAVALFVGGYWIVENKGEWGNKLESSLQAQPMQNQSQNPNQGALQSAAANQPSHAELAQTAARLANVQIVTFVDNQSHQIVQLQWTGDQTSRGGDFLDVLLRQGHLANFEETAKPAIRRTPQGERIWSAYYTLYMK